MSPRRKGIPVTVRLGEGALAALDQLVGDGAGQLPTRGDALLALSMRGHEDMVQRRRRVLADRSDRPYPLTLKVSLTEAEAAALSALADMLQGSGANRPLVTALNKVRRDLDFARDFYASNPTGRAIPFPDPPPN